MNIAVCDDQLEELKAVESLLRMWQEQQHAAVRLHLFHNAGELLEAARKERFTLYLLDVMMPGLDGYRTCLSIREYSNTPILFLSAKAQEHDKVLGFASGGDDYLTKPFSYSELTSRVKALVRRYHIYQGKPKISSQPIYRIGALVVDEQQHTVEKNAHPISLTDLEYAILLLLIKHRGQIFSASHLYEAVWEEPYYDGANNTIMVHIRNLRRKLEDDPAHPTLIRTVWGRGYRCE